MSREVSQIMTAKWNALQSEVNTKRRMKPNETLEKGEFKEILKDYGISTKEWGQLACWARRNQPNTWEMFVKHASVDTRARLPKSPEPEPEAEGEQAEAAAPCVVTAFTNVVAWLEPLQEDDRSRVIAGVQAFYGVAAS